MSEWTPRQIRGLRKTFTLSKRVLGELVGVHKDYIYMPKGGDRNPSKILCLLLDRIEKELQENEKGKVGEKHGKKSKRSL
ncbi:MAG: hypothetical protein NTU69_12005 [Proteobacteria bacterium]|nr:hypothetical protein [Pseudomonadota bacterium]